MTVGNVERQQGRRRKNRGERRREEQTKGAEKRKREEKEQVPLTQTFTLLSLCGSSSHEVVQLTLLLVSPGFSSQASCSTSFLNVPATTT